LESGKDNNKNLKTREIYPYKMQGLQAKNSKDKVLYKTQSNVAKV